MDNLFFIIIAGATVAAFVQGLTGFAYGLVALTFWAWFIDPIVAAPLVVIGSLVGQITALPAIWKNFSLNRVLPFILGGIVGIPLGVALLKFADPLVFKLIIGLILSIYCPILLFSSKIPTVHGGGARTDGLMGFIGGIMGGLAGLTGHAPTLWTTLKGWSKGAQRAVIQPFNLAMHACTLVAYVVSSTINDQSTQFIIPVALATIIPATIGMQLYKRLSGDLYRRVILALLTLSGLIMFGSSALQLI